MADVKIGNLPATTDVSSTDLIPTVDDVGGTPTTKKATVLQLDEYINDLGLVWNAGVTTLDNSWRGIAYGNNVFVAVSTTSPTNKVYVSCDGVNWESYASAEDNEWTSITYGNGLFVAVSNTGTNRVMTSSDGITWTARSVTSNEWRSVTYGDGLFVAVSSSGTANRVITSPDGITWTAQDTTGKDRDWRGVTYGNALFVAVAISGTGDRVMTSPDGITWTLRTSAVDNNWLSVTYGNGLFVAVSISGTGDRVMTSPDGITWTSRTSAGDRNWLSVTYGNGLYVAVANTGTGGRIMTSPDGINWELRSNPDDNNWTSVTYGDGLFVSMSNSGTGNRVMTSGAKNINIAPHNNVHQGDHEFTGDVTFDEDVTIEGIETVTGDGVTATLTIKVRDNGTQEVAEYTFDGNLLFELLDGDQVRLDKKSLLFNSYGGASASGVIGSGSTVSDELVTVNGSWLLESLRTGKVADATTLTPIAPARLDSLILCGGTTGTQIVNLEAVANASKKIMFIKKYATGGVLSIRSSDKIAGYDQWDTSVNGAFILLYCDGSAWQAFPSNYNDWTPIGSGLGNGVTTVTTATYTVLASDKILNVTRTQTGACAITVPTNLITTKGYEFSVKDAKNNAGTFNITIVGASGENVDFTATYTINTNGDGATFYSDGADLYRKL